MKVVANEQGIYLVADNWKNLSTREHAFISSCHYANISTEWNTDGNLQLELAESPHNIIRQVNAIIDEAVVRGVDIYGEDYLKERRNKAVEQINEERRLQEEQERVERALRMWEARKRTGCVGCKHLKRLCEDTFRCEYSGDVIGSRYFEKYDCQKQAWVFCQTGAPNQYCKDIVKIREVIK